MDLATHRNTLGLSLEECAVALGLSPTSKGWLSEIENGRRSASLRLALRIETWSKGKVPAASVCPEIEAIRPARKRA
ncbi:helix-turn-helix domain-containing protein [Brevundimonas sp.]|uniref:helix-turn-helix domain-containing protein n=1 Tax=Brevundimonas sp. TaxID=1871086 RepID=UPI003917C993